MTRQRVLITGASSGIGAELARQLVAGGRDVALCARRLDRLERLRDELGARARIYELDVNDAAAARAVFGRADADLGGLDQVVVNAGVGGGAAIGTGRSEANRTLALTNFVGALNQCEAALELFRPRAFGHLVLISSVSAQRAMAGSRATYAASKAGLSALGAGLRVELAGSGIVVTTILPGFIRTELNAKAPRLPFAVDAPRGVRSIMAAMTREPARAYTPRWPWAIIGPALRYVPAALMRTI